MDKFELEEKEIAKAQKVPQEVYFIGVRVRIDRIQVLGGYLYREHREGANLVFVPEPMIKFKVYWAELEEGEGYKVIEATNSTSYHVGDFISPEEYDRMLNNEYDHVEITEVPAPNKG